MPSAGAVVVSVLTAGAVVVGGGAVVAAVSGDPGPDRARVTKVVDGDTIHVDYDGTSHKVRLLNIDTPETKHPGKAVECLGPEATSYLEELLQPGDVVRLEFDQELHDRYGRELAGVFEDDLFVNAEIARRGLGIPVLFEPNDKFYAEVVAAYEEGKAAQAGMFSPDLTCTFASQVQGYEESVAQVEAAAGSVAPEEARSAAEEAVAAGAVVLALLDDPEPGSLAAAGLTVAELDGLRKRVTDARGRAGDVSTAAQEEIERVKAEEKAKRKAEAEAKRKAEEAERKAKEEAERKAKEEAERKAAEEAERKAAEEAQRQAEEAARQAELDRQAAEAAQRAAEEEARRQSQIQPLVPQPAPAPAPAPAPPPASVWYDNCTAARAAGAAPVYVGQPGYGRHLDRDGDGVGCE